MVWAKGFGYADLETRTPATPQTLYRIASITKTFTATALLQLRDAGLLRLDDPLSRYLPWFSIQNGFSDAAPITLAQLLTHTSGLPRESAFPYWTDNAFPSAQQLQAALAQQSTALPSSTRWKYSNLALALAGAVVEAVSGQSYSSYVQQRILKPLGMEQTLVDAPDPQHPQLAKGYTRRLPGRKRAQSPWTDTAAIAPAANMTACVEDLAQFAMLQFRGGPAGGAQVLSGGSLREMHRVQWLEPAWQGGWGWGFRIMRAGGRTLVGHGGALLGYRTQLLFDPNSKIAVVVLTNADDGDPMLYVEKAFAWVAPALEQPTAQGADPAALQPYLGKFRSAWGDLQTLIYDGQLVLIDPSLPDPMPALVRLIPLGNHRFQMESSNGFGNHAEPMHFEFENGRAVRIATGQAQNTSVAVDVW